jgi:transposase-like protein
LRTRRRFTDEFKQAAIRRLATAAVAEVAQACGVSVSVLHRWRKELGNHRAAAVADGRRRYSKEFKEAVVLRLERGESLRDVVRGSQVDPKALRRWWHEWRRYGKAAFSGYGKPRSASDSSRTVIVRFTQHEYQGIQAASLASRSHSLPDFVRAKVLSPAPSVGEIAGRLEALVLSLRRAASDFI